MSIKITSIPLTESDINHILRLIDWNKRDGTYLGNKDQYWLRSAKIEALLYAALKELDPIKIKSCQKNI